MNFQLNGHIRRHTNEHLLADIRNAAKKLNQNTISNKKYRQMGAYCPSIITRRFGSWNNALKKAGLKIKKRVNIPVKALFENLYRLWLIFGRQPSLSDLHLPLSHFGRRPYLRAFGKWSVALEQFVATHKNPYAGSADLGTNSGSPAISLPSGESQSRSFIGSRGGAISWRLRHLVMKRDHFRCLACGASPATSPVITLHIDHITPTSKGGRSTMENLQTLCSICNIGKSNL